MSRADEPPREPQPPRARRDLRIRVLVADDEPNIRTSLKRYLELDGAEVVTAENGLSAQRRLRGEAFAAAIIDLKMPAWTAWSCCAGSGRSGRACRW